MCTNEGDFKFTKWLCLDHTAPEMLALNVLYSSRAMGGCSRWQMLSNGHHGWRLGLCQRIQPPYTGWNKMSAVDWQVVSVQMAAAPVWYCANNVARCISFWSSSQPALFWKAHWMGCPGRLGQWDRRDCLREVCEAARAPFKGAFNRAHMLWDAKEPTSPLSSLKFETSFPLSLILLWVPLLRSVVRLPAIDLCMFANTPPAQVWICLFSYALVLLPLCGVLSLFLLQTLAPSPSRSLSPQAVHM